MFLKPAKGRAVRDPISHVLLPADGEEKPDTRFWRRRVRDEDVVVCTSPTPTDAQQPSTSDASQPAAPATAEEH